MLQQAVTYLNEAIKIHPTYKNAYLLLGNSYYFLNDFDKSIAAYKKSLALDPDFKDATNNLAVVYRDAGRNAGENKTTLVWLKPCCCSLINSIPMMLKPIVYWALPTASVAGTAWPFPILKK
ncbi:MAG: tetratricopeptide repeat protein [Saprospiraceae bacterium]|nr:tetratricopeptide repeat protein [Saprospiraceae bacterium]